jgi:dihydrofolate reductase
MEYDEVWIIGGASLYKQFLDLHLVNKCYITTIDKHYECDTFFPELSSDEWVLNNTFTLSDETSVCVFDYAS